MGTIVAPLIGIYLRVSAKSQAAAIVGIPSIEPDVNISALARSLDVSPSQLFGWRRAAARRATEVAKRAAEEAVADRPKRVEIEVGGAVVRVTADIAEDDLRRLLRAVRQS